MPVVYLCVALRDCRVLCTLGTGKTLLPKQEQQHSARRCINRAWRVLHQRLLAAGQALQLHPPVVPRPVVTTALGAMRAANFITCTRQVNTTQLSPLHRLAAALEVQ